MGGVTFKNKPQFIYAEPEPTKSKKIRKWKIEDTSAVSLPGPRNMYYYKTLKQHNCYQFFSKKSVGRCHWNY